MSNAVDFRLLGRPTLDVNLEAFSEWCWAGHCADFPPSRACRVPCACDCHHGSRPGVSRSREETR